MYLDFLSFSRIIRRLIREADAGETLNSRILIITGSDNECDKYVRFMNIIFTAQKLVSNKRDDSFGHPLCI